MSKSKIEWTDSSWNPITGCTKISDGCKHCYAERLAKRLKAMKNPNYFNGFNLTIHENSLQIPFSWKKPQNIFVCSMSDLFHEDVPDDFIVKIFDIMNKADWHRFQVLTKRADRMAKIANKLKWSDNIWAGVTVENNEYKYRIDQLLTIPAKVKFISFEPLIGQIDQPIFRGIDWVIVGGESGPGHRAIKEEWILTIKDECEKTEVPFFFKQWGGINKKKTGRTLQGQTWDGYPNWIDNII